MIRDNFIEEMQFYDKDNMPESLFQQLGEFYNNPEFTPESVQSASYAAATLCQWVRAVYEYVQICRAVKPKMEELMQAEQQLNTVSTNHETSECASALITAGSSQVGVVSSAGESSENRSGSEY